MNFLRSLFSGPTVRAEITRQLHETEIDLLRAQALAEHYTATAEMLAHRLARLRLASANCKDPS